LDNSASETDNAKTNQEIKRTLTNRPVLKIIACNDTELQEHQQRLVAIEKASGACLWNK
jgi:DNA polymerase-3 subunit epsilon